MNTILMCEEKISYWPQQMGMSMFEKIHPSDLDNLSECLLLRSWVKFVKALHQENARGRYQKTAINQ